MQTMAQPLNLSRPSAEESARLTQDLISTRDALLECLSGLPDAQWSFKPDAETWSLGEILEHLALIEDRVHGIIEKMPSAPEDDPNRAALEFDNLVLARVLDRSNKIKAPAAVEPTGEWKGPEALEVFRERRARTLQLLAEAPYIRGRVLPHRILGPLDGYQWLISVSAHTARHMPQIEEVKACFPCAT